MVIFVEASGNPNHTTSPPATSLHRHAQRPSSASTPQHLRQSGPVVAEGGPPLDGATMSEKRGFLARYDWIRAGLMFEPLAQPLT